MIRRFVAVTFLLLAMAMAMPAMAADPWSESDRNRELVFLALTLVDWGQTRDIAARPDLFVEHNPLLGEHPSSSRVNAYFATVALLNVGVVHVLPASWRPAFQFFCIGYQAGVVFTNHRVGLRVNF